MKNELLQAFYELIPEVKGQMFDEIASNRTRYLTVLLEEIFQEHNASAVLRSCDCFGIQELHVVESKNQYKVQRDIARGAGRWVDLFNYNEGPAPLLDAVSKLKSKGYKIAALTPDAELSIFDLPLDQPVALSFGTEWEGISDEIREIADYKVAIPMVGFTESFNVSVSVALTLQALRQRLIESDVDWKLNEADQTDVKLKWCQRYMRNGDVVRRELEKRLQGSND